MSRIKIHSVLLSSALLLIILVLIRPFIYEEWFSDNTRDSSEMRSIEIEPIDGSFLINGRRNITVIVGFNVTYFRLHMLRVIVDGREIGNITPDEYGGYNFYKEIGRSPITLSEGFAAGAFTFYTTVDDRVDSLIVVDAAFIKVDSSTQELVTRSLNVTSSNVSGFEWILLSNMVVLVYIKKIGRENK